MVMMPEPDGPEAAFVMEADDRFHKIITSGDIRFTEGDSSVSIITFFIVRRVLGFFDIFIVHKVFLPSDEVSRTVQSKLGLRQSAVDREVAKIRDVFGAAVTAATKVRIDWKELDLAGVTGRKQQLKLIRAWGGVKVLG